MYEDHPDFIKPNDENAKIWRYMDFTKFVSLLDNSALFFARADKLGDSFEGSYPKKNIKYRPLFAQIQMPQPIFLKKFNELTKTMLRFTAINCWHLSDYESSAMWVVYSKNSYGISIQSTFRRLRDGIIDDRYRVYIGKVQYVDYDTDIIPEGNAFFPFLYKRKAFEHEKELRAITEGILLEHGDYDVIKKKKGKIIPFPTDNGIYMKVNLDVLIDKIYIAPSTPTWFEGLVKSFIGKYGLVKQSLHSQLDDNPQY